MKHRLLVGFAGLASLLALTVPPASAEVKRAHLEGNQEVPVVSTDGEGKCRVKISENSGSLQLDVKLSYSGLAGTVQQAHIHVAQPNVNGGIVLFFCSNITTPVPPAGTPPCPGPHDGTVTRTLTSADIVPQTMQGIAAGQLDEVIDEMRRGKTYCNIHSDMSPAGEIRGQLQPR